MMNDTIRYIVLWYIITSFSCNNIYVNGESVWNKLQDHTKKYQKTASSTTNSKNSKDGNEINNYPLLFVDNDDNNKMNDKNMKNIPPANAPIEKIPSGIMTNTTLSTTNRKGMMMMTMSSQSKSPITKSINATSSSSPAPGRMMMMSMKQNVPTVSPSTTIFPSLSLEPSVSRNITNGKGMMMISMDEKSKKTSSPTSSPSTSYEPTISLYPTITSLSMGMSIPKNKKTTPSPTASYEPTLSVYPTLEGMMKGMSKVRDDKAPRPSPSASYVPSISLYPTYNNKGMGMSKSKDDKIGTTSSPSSSTYEPTLISPSPSIELNTGKGMGMSKSKEQTFSPSITSVPTTTYVPSLLPSGMMMMDSNGMGMGDGDEMMMGMGMGMGMMSKDIQQSPSPTALPIPKGMNMKKDMNHNDDSKMNMSKISPKPTSPPSSSSLEPETIVPTSPPNILPTAPTTDGTNRVGLSPYTLQYGFDQTRVPYAFEVDEVVIITRMYLANYFEIRYTNIMEFLTNSTGTQFTLLQPFRVNYTSAAVFSTREGKTNNDEVSLIVPPVEELDIVLIAAFTGQNLASYISQLNDLPPENIFRTTTNVTFAIHPIGNDDSNTTLRVENTDNNHQERNKAIVTGGIIGGAGVLFIFLISVMAATRHKKNKRKRTLQMNGEYNIHDKGNMNDDEGHMTVSGDTYIADSTVISGDTRKLFPLSSSSRRRRRSGFFTKKQILSPSRELIVHPSSDVQSLVLPSLSSTPPPMSSPTDMAIASLQRRGISNIDDEDGDGDDDDDHTDSDQEIYEDDDRSLLPFYGSSSSQQQLIYHGALRYDSSNERHNDVLSMRRDDMRLPRHFTPSSADDILPHHMNDIDTHFDVEYEDDDDDTLSVDDDVPLRVIDLIRKFTPNKRNKAR